MEGNFNKEDTQVSIGKKDNINDHDLNSSGQRKQIYASTCGLGFGNFGETGDF